MTDTTQSAAPITLAEIRDKIRRIKISWLASTDYHIVEDADNLVAEIDRAIAAQEPAARVDGDGKGGAMTKAEVAEKLAASLRESWQNIDHAAAQVVSARADGNEPDTGVRMSKEEILRRLGNLIEFFGKIVQICPGASDSLQADLMLIRDSVRALPDPLAAGDETALLLRLGEQARDVSPAISDAVTGLVRQGSRVIADGIPALIADHKRLKAEIASGLEATVDLDLAWRRIRDELHAENAALATERDGLLAQLAERREATQGDRPREDYLKPSVMSVFHRAWTHDVGEPGYDKRRWLDMETRLLAAAKELEA